jgi:amino acid transporter
MKKQNTTSKIGLLSAISISIGGMVGGGIFAVLGLAVYLAQGATPVAFLFAGIIALSTTYAYIKLSISYPDDGGTVRFINEGFGINILSGGINNLLWVSYIIMLALYSTAFGSYAPKLFSITGDAKIDAHIYITLIILISTIINYYSIKIVGEIESAAVVIKLIILVAFVIIGFIGIENNVNFTQLDPSNWESPIKIIAGGMVIFVAYEGFELIANSSKDIINPKRNIPLAYIISVVFVVLLYIAISIVTVGTLDFGDIAKAQDYVLAEAAKPKLGQIGFTIITIAALISTFSAINATLLGGSRVNYTVAKDAELPTYFSQQFHGKPIGLAIITIATLIFANTMNLNSISTSGSIGFLLIFAAVNWVAIKKSKEINGNKIISSIAFLLTSLALIVLIIQQSGSNLTGVLISLGIIAISFIGEWIYKKYYYNK